ncbi:MAG: beta-N-acetylhexosaminidase, partial [Candidatus Limnocylindria bacterium]
LVPVPAAIRTERGSFTVDTTTVIRVVSGGEEAMRVAAHLAEVVGATPESRPRILTGEAAGEAAIVLALDPTSTPELGPEGYTLRVAAEGIRIDAAEPAGLFYGVQTLRQLLPASAEFEAARPRPLPVPYVDIEDRPRFRWRGAMLDVARHFFGVEAVKRYIDLLALHKMNRLHLHLADDQGWRIEVPGWPRLTEHGGSTEVGGGSGGFYTTQEYRELVRYAADRFITIVPEIDLPGHTNAALASVPELNCDGVAPPLYTGIEVGFSAVCVHNDATYEFVDAVLGHLASITPGSWLHVGGDEVEELTEEEYRLFIDRVESIVHGHGKRMAGWQEITSADIH